MTATQPKELTLADLLNAGNKHYDDNYLSTYFDAVSGKARVGSGDTLAKLIVSELRESFDHKSCREQQVATAIRALQNLGEDIQNAIHGLQEL
jgi:hypothetical protein